MNIINNKNKKIFIAVLKSIFAFFLFCIIMKLLEKVLLLSKKITIKTFLLILEKLTKKLLAISALTNISYLNAFICYLVINFLCWLLIKIIWLLVLLIIKFFYTTYESYDLFIFGEKHEKSLDYKFSQIWYLKLKSDFCRLLIWTESHLFIKKTAIEKTMFDKANLFTFTKLIDICQGVFSFFFGYSFFHLLCAFYVVYIYCFNSINYILGFINNVFIISKISISNFINLFNLLILFILISYIFLDVRHKASGYSKLREERFNDLFEIEENLFDILIKINTKLKNNIDVFISKKYCVLTNGASKLLGEECVIVGSKINSSINRKYQGSFPYYNNNPFQNFSEMNELLDQFNNINDKLMESSISYSKLFYIDPETMITKLTHFYFPYKNNYKNKGLQLLAKSSIEEWYENYFNKPIKFGNKILTLSKDEVNKKIFEASYDLDFFLFEAMMLQAWLSGYERKMKRRFKKINNYSRFNFK